MSFCPFDFIFCMFITDEYHFSRNAREIRTFFNPLSLPPTRITSSITNGRLLWETVLPTWNTKEWWINLRYHLSECCCIFTNKIQNYFKSYIKSQISHTSNCLSKSVGLIYIWAIRKSKRCNFWGYYNYWIALFILRRF